MYIFNYIYQDLQTTFNPWPNYAYKTDLKGWAIIKNVPNYTIYITIYNKK